MKDNSRPELRRNERAGAKEELSRMPILVSPPCPLRRIRPSGMVSSTHHLLRQREGLCSRNLPRDFGRIPLRGVETERRRGGLKTVYHVKRWLAEAQAGKSLLAGRRYFTETSATVFRMASEVMPVLPNKVFVFPLRESCTTTEGVPGTLSFATRVPKYCMPARTSA